MTFSVPPLITAGWQDAFKEMWKEKVHATDEESCFEVIQLLELWRPVEYPQITPRLLKKFVNDIHILDLTVPAKDDYRNILISLYILVVRYGEIDIRELIVSYDYNASFDNTDQKDQNEEKRKVVEKLNLTQRQLNRVFSGNSQRWSEFLMSVHYQAEVELARSELIDNPLIEAVRTQDTSSLEKIISLWGFTHAWLRCQTRMEMESWLESVAQLPVDMLENVRPQINIAYQHLNVTYALKDCEKLNRNFSNALLKLQQAEMLKSEPFIERQRDFLLSDLNYLQEFAGNNDLPAIEILEEANIYSKLGQENLIDEMAVEIDGEFYARYLLDQSDKYPYLKPDMCKLSDYNIGEMLLVILEESTGDVFNPLALSHFKLASQRVGEIIDTEDSNRPENLNRIFSLLANRNQIDNFTDFRKLIFCNEWHSSSLIQHYAYQAKMKSDYPVEYAAHIVAHMVAIKNFTGIEAYIEYIDNNEYIKILSWYLRCAKSFSTVMQSIMNPAAEPYVCQAINLLFKNNVFGAISSIDYMKIYYPVIKRNNKDDADLFQILIEREDKFIPKIDLKVLDELNNEFVTDLFNSDLLQNTRSLLHKLCSSGLDSQNGLYAAFVQISPNRLTVLDRVAEIGIRFHLNTNTGLFADWYRKADAKNITEGKYLRFIWSLLQDEQQVDILAQLHDVLLEVQTTTVNRVKIIHDFKDVLMFKEPSGKGGRRGIAALFAFAANDEMLREWLDLQRYSFGNWDPEDERIATQYILENRSVFPGICSSSVYIRNRLSDEVAQ